MIDSIVGQKFKTKYDDEILVLEQMPKEKGKNLLFRCQFQKYPYEVFREKSQILSGSCINPLQEQKEFIEKIWFQNCGDFLKILKKSDTKFGYYLCKFIKYPYTREFQKTKIIQGKCVNPRIEEEEFIGKEFLQNCGDILKVLNKTNNRIKEKGNCFYECEFLKYPFKTFALKGNILSGRVLNPQIEQIEFVEKIWPQHCGDSLKIIKIIKYKKEKRWECEFIKYPCKIFARYETIKNGEVDNPRIEEEEFLNKEWFQNCGDSVKVEKSNKYKIRERGKTRLYKYTFLKYPYSGYAQKISIKQGRVDNPNLPYKSKEGILNVINTFFKNEKPTLSDLAKKLNISVSYVGKKITEYNLQNKIKFSAISIEEENLRKYCISLNNSFLDKSDWSVLETKEIDIYSPKLKLGIEFNGDYWHSDEMCYKNYGISSQERDKLKYNLAKEKGIDLYFIWEHDWKGRQDVVKRYIKILLNKYQH